MKKVLFFILIFVFLFAVALSAYNKVNNEKDAIKKAIVEGYIEGVITKGDAEMVKKGWHEDCEIVVFKNGKLQKVDVKYWIDRFEKNPGPYAPNTKVKYEFEDIKVTGYAAIVALKVFYNGKQKYTDYMNLYKFEEGWKVATKTFYTHF
ncbi:nuclear transport factor 2 family protein [candidate division KSB1 bacterium]